jgi:hypothetical protein
MEGSRVKETLVARKLMLWNYHIYKESRTDNFLHDLQIWHELNRKINRLWLWGLTYLIK